MPTPSVRFKFGFAATALFYACWPVVVALSSPVGWQAWRQELTFTVFHICVLPYFVGMGLALIPSLRTKSISDQVELVEKPDNFADRKANVVPIPPPIIESWWAWFTFGSVVVASISVGYAVVEAFTTHTQPYAVQAASESAKSMESLKIAFKAYSAPDEEDELSPEGTVHDQSKPLTSEDKKKRYRERFKVAKSNYLKTVDSSVPKNFAHWLSAIMTGTVATLMLSLGFVRPIVTASIIPLRGEDRHFVRVYPFPRFDRLTIWSAMAWPLLRIYVEWYHGRFLFLDEWSAEYSQSSTVVMAVTVAFISGIVVMIHSTSMGRGLTLDDLKKELGPIGLLTAIVAATLKLFPTVVAQGFSFVNVILSSDIWWILLLGIGGVGAVWLFKAGLEMAVEMDRDLV